MSIELSVWSEERKNNSMLTYAFFWPHCFASRPPEVPGNLTTSCQRCFSMDCCDRWIHLLGHSPMLIRPYAFHFVQTVNHETTNSAERMLLFYSKLWLLSSMTFFTRYGLARSPISGSVSALHLMVRLFLGLGCGELIFTMRACHGQDPAPGLDTWKHMSLCLSFSAIP